MYSAVDVPAVNRSDERHDHPLLKAWRSMRVSKNFSRDEVRALVAPVYMGLIKELDDQMGRLFKYLKESGRFDDTMIVFCSIIVTIWVIIGWEKKICSMIVRREYPVVYDPRKNDKTRGTVSDALVEGIDLTPTH